MSDPIADGGHARRLISDLSRMNIDLEADLKGAAARGELVAYFQPQVELPTGRVVAAEALCRWRHPGLGVISPEVFIEIAERSDVIHEIGTFMFAAGFDFLETSAAHGLALDLAINVSPAQLTTPQIVDEITTLLDTRAVDPARVIFEITEAVQIVDLHTVASRLTVLRDHGVGISIDDFGTGHWAAEEVRALPATEIKIDRSLIQRASPEGEARFAEAMELAAEFRLRVVAEGVETADERDYAIAMGCHRAQGYFYSKAMSALDFEALR